MDGRRYRFENVDGRKLYAVAEERGGQDSPETPLQASSNGSVDVTKSKGLSLLPSPSFATSKSNLKLKGRGHGPIRRPLLNRSIPNNGKLSFMLKLASVRSNIEEAPSTASTPSEVSDLFGLESSMPESPLLMISRRNEMKLRAPLNTYRGSPCPTRQNLSRLLPNSEAARYLKGDSLQEASRVPKARSGKRDSPKKKPAQGQDFAIWEDECDKNDAGSVNTSKKRALRDNNINETRATKRQRRLGNFSRTIEKVSEEKISAARRQVPPAPKTMMTFVVF